MQQAKYAVLSYNEGVAHLNTVRDELSPEAAQEESADPVCSLRRRLQRSATTGGNHPSLHQ